MDEIKSQSDGDIIDKNLSDLKSHKGHRQRLRERFMKGGAKAMADYEMLELLLCMGIPRRDVKPLAKELIAHFGDFANVVEAPADKLSKFKGMSGTAVAALKVVQASVLLITQERVVKRPILSNWQSLIDYLRAAMGHFEREQFRVLYLDRKNNLLADDVQGDGSINHTPVYPREVVKRGLEVGASALIIVHNHPSGDPSPSKDDINMTNKVQKACQNLDMCLHDHVIICRSGHVSFKAQGLL